MEKTFTTQDGRVFTKTGFESIVNSIVDRFMQRDKKIRQIIYQQHSARGEKILNAPVDPGSLRGNYLENVTKSMYDKLGIPQNYFN
ncbi:MAG: hypothetical protein PVJ67_00800 [Candidatus Pacearchaeota archaeon]|jgi:hypothetical protein